MCEGIPVPTGFVRLTTQANSYAFWLRSLPIKLENNKVHLFDGNLKTNENDNKKALLLAQSYMPAQEIHVLKNPRNSETNPWYTIEETDLLYTPEWTFRWSDLKRFKRVFFL